MLYFGLSFIFIFVFGLVVLEFYDHSFYKRYAKISIEKIGIDEYTQGRARASKFKGKIAIIAALGIIVVGLLSYYGVFLKELFLKYAAQFF